MVDASLVRLVNGVLVPGLVGEDEPDWLATEIDAGLGSVCWFGGASLAAVHRARPDLIVMSDEEGGNVTRLEMARGSSFPGNAALGTLDDTEATEQVGVAIGSLARDAGVHVVLAPVVDVNSEPDNPVIGVRSFGDDPSLVARHASAFVRGLQSRGVAGCAKHFPGHGATRTDSHTGLPVVAADRRTFLERDVAPFAAVVDAGVRCVMTAHISVPAFDDAPATLSEVWMRHLRGELGFSGLIVTDALDMHAISRGVGRGAGAVAALRAGADMACIGNPQYPEPYDAAAVLDSVRRDVLAAIANDELPVARLEEAAGRVDALRAWLASEGSRTVVGGEPAATTAAEAIGRDVAARAVHAVGQVRLAAAPHVVVEQRTDIAAGRVASPLVAELGERGQSITTEAVSAAHQVLMLDVPDRPVIVVSDGLAGDDVVDAVRAKRPDAVVVHTGPARLDQRPIEPPVVVALGNGAANARAVADLLLGSS